MQANVFRQNTRSARLFCLQASWKMASQRRIVYSVFTRTCQLHPFQNPDVFFAGFKVLHE
jgi:hypothetical protein